MNRVGRKGFSYRKIACCVLLALLQLSLIGQMRPEPVFRHYTMDDGLLSLIVYQIKQDQHGYLWMATENGVSRFDGNHYDHFTIEDGLCNSTYFGIFEDKSGKVWFYGSTGELSYFDYEDEAIHCPSFNQELRKYTNGYILNSMCISDSTIYVYSKQDHGWQIELHADAYDIKEISFNHTITIVETDDCVCYSAIERYNPSRLAYKNPTTFYEKNLSEEIKWYDNSNSTLGLIEENKYVHLYAGWMTIFDKESKALEQRKFPYLNTQSAFTDKANNFWVGLYHQGAIMYPNSDLDQEPRRYLDGVTVTSICQDNEGGYWFSTAKKGVYYASSLGIKHFSPSNGFLVEAPHEMISDGKQLVFGCFDGTLGLIDSLDQLSFIYKTNRELQGLMVHQDTIFFQEPRAWVKYSLKDGEISKRRALGFRLRDPEHGMVFTNVSKLNYCYMKAEGKEIDTIIKVKIPTFMNRFGHRRTYRLNSGNLLLKSINQLLFYDLKKNDFQMVKTDEGKDIEVMSIYALKGDQALLATKGKGVLWVNKQHILATLIPTEMLKGRICHRVIFEDDEHLWVGTNKGLLLVQHPFDSERRKVMNYARRKDITASNIISMEKMRAKLYLGTGEGIGIIPFKELHRRKLPPKVIIKEAMVGDRNTKSIENKIVTNEKDIRVSFSSFNFYNGLNVPYRYRFSNKEDDWEYTYALESKFPELSPGNYVYELQAGNGMGDWGESSFLSFQIIPPFWRSWWFIILIILISISLIWFIADRRVKEVKRLAVLSQQINVAKQTALNAQMNPHFIYNSLNSVMYYFTSNEKRDAITYLGKFSQLMRTVFENSRESFIRISEELEALKQYLDLECIRQKGHLSYHVHVEEAIELDLLYMPALILQPFVENAILHGILPKEASGEVQISVVQKEERICCLIKDNGIGRLAAAKRKTSVKSRKHSGMEVTKERLNLLKIAYGWETTFSVKDLMENDQAVGTEVYICFPLIYKIDIQDESSFS